MDVGRLMRRLAADGYVGSLSVEYCWRDIPWERAATARTFLAACLAAKEALA
jgi:sugar phosphate isomerase/epimerase